MKVRAKVKCFAGNAIREKGEIFDYVGPENGCLEALEMKASPAGGKKPAPAEGKKPAGAEEAFE